MDRNKNNNNKNRIKYVMANTIWKQAAHITYQLSSPSCSTRAIQKVP